MPFYSYRDKRTGEVQRIMATIAERDSFPHLERIYEPGTPLPRINSKRPSLQAEQVLGGYRKLEEKGELRVSRRRANVIKAAWAGQ